ncbi:CpaF/VirB11 family protein [Lactococcus lactis]|uniref:CpaF/VirB11 family protein n=1 Tax=Lactococcus lactis TaxID=1358 RepID=UPI002890299B|nr:CpaF/VirB11 family protein [Lactococcus lactis]MDT2914534.1 CpaF/VirB11 family protein [Lactococcus lactis]MDT2938670.1 CpaF/VirB11 family protein [Lactococcus lactis]
MPKLKSLLKVKRDDELPLLSIGLPTKKERVKPVKVEKKKRTMEAETVVRKVPKEKKKKEVVKKKKIKDYFVSQPVSSLSSVQKNKKVTEEPLEEELERIIDDSSFIDTLKEEAQRKPVRRIWTSNLLKMSDKEAQQLRDRMDAEFKNDIALDTSLFDNKEEKRQILKYVDQFIYSYYASWKLEAFYDLNIRTQLRDKLKKEAPRLRKFPNAVLDELLEESVGLGVIERLIRNETISDIGYNGTQLIVESNEQKEINETGGFVDSDYIHRLINNFVSTIGKEFNSTNPVTDVVYKNMRVNAVHENSANGAVTISIRVSHTGIMVTDKVVEEMSNDAMTILFEAFVLAKCNIVVCGETGSGKTEMTKHLLSFIPFTQKICLIEDVSEMHAKEIFPNADINSWVVTRSASADELLKASLRNNPTWVVVTELRGGDEANEWLQAIRSDHKSITSLHSDSALSIPNRIMGMIGEVRNVQEDRIENEIKRLLNIGIHINVEWIHGRKVRYIADVVEFRNKEQGDSITLFTQEMDKDGNRSIKMNRISSKLHKTLELSGFDLSRYDELMDEYEQLENNYEQEEA